MGLYFVPRGPRQVGALRACKTRNSEQNLYPVNEYIQRRDGDTHFLNQWDISFLWFP